MDNQQSLFGESAEELQECLASLESAEAQEAYKRWPSTLQTVSLLIQREVEKQPSNAKQLADNITIALSHYMGGRDMYLPTNERIVAALRDIKIWQEFNGRNMEQLANKYQLTPRRIAEIIQFQREAEIARKQRCLF